MTTVVIDFKRRPTRENCLISIICPCGRAAKADAQDVRRTGERMNPRTYKERKLRESVPINYRGVCRVLPSTDLFGFILLFFCVLALAPIFLVTATLTDSKGVPTASLAAPIMAVAFDAVAVVASIAMDAAVHNPVYWRRGTHSRSQETWTTKKSEYSPGFCDRRSGSYGSRVCIIGPRYKETEGSSSVADQRGAQPRSVCTFGPQGTESPRDCRQHGRHLLSATAGAGCTCVCESSCCRAQEYGQKCPKKLGARGAGTLTPAPRLAFLSFPR